MTDKEQKEIFSYNLNKLLSATGKSQKEVADAINVSPQTFNTWCQGIAIPRMGKIQLLSDYFSIQKSDLIEKKKQYTYKHIVGDRILQLCTEKNIPLEELAEYIGYTLTGVDALIHNEVTEISEDTFFKITQLLGNPSIDFLCGQETIPGQVTIWGEMIKGTSVDYIYLKEGSQEYKLIKQCRTLTPDGFREILRYVDLICSSPKFQLPVPYTPKFPNGISENDLFSFMEDEKKRML